MTMIPPRVRIPRSDTPSDRYGAVAVSLFFHILIIVLQAFIFMVLSVVYIAMAHEHH